MTMEEPSHSRRDRSRSWFGPASFGTALVVMFSNIVPLTILPALTLFFAVGYLAETVLAAVLCALGGRAREIGTGLAVAVVTTMALFATALAATFLAEHL